MKKVKLILAIVAISLVGCEKNGKNNNHIGNSYKKVYSDNDNGFNGTYEIYTFISDTEFTREYSYWHTNLGYTERELGYATESGTYTYSKRKNKGYFDKEKYGSSHYFFYFQGNEFCYSYLGKVTIYTKN